MEKILIVDDSEMNREILAEIFDEQYETMQAADGEEAIAIIDSNPKELDLIFLDLMMPKKNGLDVLAYMRRKGLLEKIPVIMITGEATVESDMKAYEYGAADIIYKPFAEKVVMRRAQNIIELYKKREKTEEELAKRTVELRKSREQLETINSELIEALGSVVEFRSLESGQHVQRVKNFTRILLKYVQSCYPEYGLTDEQIELMSAAAALHDLGKIAIPDEILNAPRRLTAAEFAEMKKHTTYGCEILEKFKFQDSDFYKYCYDIIRWHHEKADGSGYPDGLVEKDIPIYCQAVAIADCFDALSSKRVYKQAYNVYDAYNMIVAGDCGQFSEVILKCLDLAKLEMFVAIDQQEHTDE